MSVLGPDQSIISSHISSRRNSLRPLDENISDNEDIVGQMQQGASNILVAVRCRPLTKKEREIDSTNLIQIIEERVVILMDPQFKYGDKGSRAKEKQYAFDFAFDENSLQKEIFDKTTKFLIDGILNGFNATVFAYGATGAGKTYTMLGEADSPGMMLMTFVELFTKVEELTLERAYKVKLSYLEIYNEVVKDLIHPTSSVLDIREDPVKGIVVAGLAEMIATTPDEVIECIQLGNMRRTCEPTEANQTSSRSHAVLQITVEYKDKAAGTQSEIIVGKLSLIDLAGSERASHTKNRGIRLIEGANINKSLLALGNCINALCEATERGGKVYIPYRDSKLTRLLKDSLGGNCRTVMIACISPYSGSFFDTSNTLKYANRAKNIKTNLHRNVVNVSYHIAKYTAIIAQLRQEVSELRKQLKSRTPNPTVFNNEKFQIELNTHFQEEAKIRKKIYECQQTKEELGFMLFEKQAEMNQAKSKNGEENAGFKALNREVERLKKAIEEQNQINGNYEEMLKGLEHKRDDIKQEWIRKGVPEPYLSSLQLMMQQQILAMNSIDAQRDKNHEQVILKQKDLYIELLKSQLRLRDNVIEIQNEVFKESKVEVKPGLKKIYSQIQSLEEINSSSIVSFPELHGNSRSTNHRSKAKTYKTDHFLPPIIHIPANKTPASVTPSRIPRINSKRYLSTEQKSEPPKSSNVNLLHPKAKRLIQNDAKFKERSRTNSGYFDESDSEKSTAKQMPSMVKVSDRSQKGHYAGQKVKDEKHLVKKRIKPTEIKYGISIRGIETFV
ncbi:unnamed protein product [Blepharisma stoltei]|uniref:Kinesin-like protein n=1 Tax=Blepharisma stoltei TaxID=1481888 RepID=A0AAU9J059_9CILI|nr:unnamed protein product [Blepharisma stoltei]